MNQTLTITDPLLQPLSSLGLMRRPDFAYSKAMRTSVDPYVAAGAWCVLIESKSLPRSWWPQAVAASKSSAVRNRLFAFAERAGHRELMEQTAAAASAAVDDAKQRKMLATLNFDGKHASIACGDLYLATGDIEHLIDAAIQAQADGWRESVPWAARAIAIAPMDTRGWGRLYMILRDVGQADLLKEVAGILSASGLHPLLETLFSASSFLFSGEPQACLDRLKPLSDERVLTTAALVEMLADIRNMRADSEEKLGNYRTSFKLLQSVNDIDRRATKIRAEKFYENAKLRDALVVPELPPPTRRDTVQMLGFPRSGTTLLENVLAVHSKIETFEEIPSVSMAYAQIERVLDGYVGQPETPSEMYIRARAKYYEQLDSRRRNEGASVLIDKMPLRSVEVPFLHKIFPEWRYIFSIRHPYDVVLSCFKQRFAPNPAMENFHTIEEGARLYDYTMTRWFEHFSMDDPRVVYARYDDLVLDFEPTVRTVLSFLGLDWEDNVAEFAAASERRAARTPSYKKVRQGLSIGVQSSWRKYDFVFASPAAAPLHKWAAFFGYETVTQ